MLFKEIDNTHPEDCDEFKELLKDKNKHIFMFMYLVGCGPCGVAKPEWDKLKGTSLLSKYNDNDNVVLACVDENIRPKLEIPMFKSIETFPYIKYLKNGTLDEDEYKKERSEEAFSEWIKQTVDANPMKNISNFKADSDENPRNFGNVDSILLTHFRLNKKKNKYKNPSYFDNNDKNRNFKGTKRYGTKRKRSYGKSSKRSYGKSSKSSYGKSTKRKRKRKRKRKGTRNRGKF